MLVSFGPRADVARALAPDPGEELRRPRPAGATDIPKVVTVFYEETRSGISPWTYSLISVLAPLLIILFAFSVGHWFVWVNPRHFTPIACSDETALDAGGMRFAATLVALLVVCSVAYGAGVVCTQNVLSAHSVFGRRKLCTWSFSIFVTLGVGSLPVFTFWIFWKLGTQTFIQEFFPGCTIQNDQSLAAMEWIGASAVSLGVMSTAVAVAVLAFRFETPHVNGTWSHPYVLRNKLHSTLTLFFIGSIMLVTASVEMNSRIAWFTAIPASAKILAPDSISIKSSDLEDALRASVENFYGGVGSLILMAIFIPALFKHTREIEIAGACHAYYESIRPKDPAVPLDPNKILYVADWKMIQEWKDNHGLAMSLSDLTGSFVAVLAPILSSSIIDLTKVIPGAGH